MDVSSKVWDKAAVQALIAGSDKALAQALWQIYQRQTTDERSMGHTSVQNGRGFNAQDAKFLSSVAAALPRWSFHMTKPQRDRVRPMMRKYWRQLLEEIEARGGVVDYGTPFSEIATSPNREVAASPNSDFVPQRIVEPVPAAWGSF